MNDSPGLPMTPRPSGRQHDELRPVRITPPLHAPRRRLGADRLGDTRVLCTASVEESVPGVPQGQRAGLGHRRVRHAAARTSTRTPPRGRGGQASGRTQEIQRLIGRSLRAVADLTAARRADDPLDCDVLQADGGTRCAAITGACVALSDALRWCRERESLAGEPLTDFVAAVSVGIVDGRAVLDLDYAEDSQCEVDMNVVMTGQGGFVEVQGTAEGAPFSRRQFEDLVALAEGGIAHLVAEQEQALGLLKA